MDPAFLGVSQSLTGRRWQGPAAETLRRAEQLAQETGLPAAVCGVLAERDVAPAEISQYLSPKIRDLLPDPRRLKDASVAAERLNAAVERAERVAIFADYDVDGGASAALLINWLRQLGRGATLYVPDRIDEGYGPNAPAMAELAAAHDLIICVDCGTLSHDALAAAGGLADVIVLDHHLGAETLPPALAVVNPNRQDETGDLGHLCAAAVVFLVLVDARRQRKAAGATAPDLMECLDLVALATVADVAPLIGVNRAFVKQGLKVMAGRGRPGLVALADTAKLDSAPKSYHLGYVLGPRINAGGRIGQADLGAQLLSTDDAGAARVLAERLEALNAERREIETAVRTSALAQAEARGDTGPLVWAAGDHWHPGVIGIVAARLKETFGRPALVFGFDDASGKGSGRSVPGVDLGAAIQRLARDGFIEKGGGHRMAAGLSLRRDQLEPAMARLSELLARQGPGQEGAASLRINGLLLPEAASVSLVETLEQAGPYGAAAPAPRFAFPDCRILDVRQIGQGHLKLRFGDGHSKPNEAVAFGAWESELGIGLAKQTGALFHLAGRLELNSWGGRTTVQLSLEDAAPAGVP